MAAAVGHPDHWSPGWRLVDWQGELVETPWGPAVGAGVYRYDGRTRKAIRLTREHGLIHLDPYYDRLHHLGLSLYKEIHGLWRRFVRARSPEGRLRLLLRGLAAEARLSIVRELYEEPGILCLTKKVDEALRLAGYEDAMQLAADGALRVPAGGHPFHDYLRRQTRPA